MRLRLITNLIILNIMCTGSLAQWQWSVPVPGGIEKAGPAKAYLWIPPECEQLRGVVVAQHNMEEISILENLGFRTALSKLGFAEVWCSPGFDHLFRFTERAGETFNRMMQDLAVESGYTELTYVPVVPLGHSAAASWPYYFAVWAPDRTLAAISVSGQWPYFRDPVFAPDIWGDRTLDFVPCLETMGEYESAVTWSREGLKQRQDHPNLPLSMLACPAEGHFAATDKKAAYLALYIKKAVQHRVPKDWTGDGPPALIPIDPTKTGWLKDKWRQDQGATAPSAPVGEYSGDSTEAFWFFDKRLVRVTEAYEAEYKNQKAQLLGYVQAGEVVSQRNSHMQVHLRFLPQADGVTFKLTGTFLSTVPDGSPRPAIWTDLSAGSAIGHASSEVAISIDAICGPVTKLGPDTFRLSLQRGQGINLNHYSLYFAATHCGDTEYKPAVQQAEMIVPLKNTEGTDQHLTFPAIPDQSAGTESIKLKAVSDAKVPVYYYVEAGPAILDGDTLTFTAIPPRSKWPIKVTVVAWQYGRSIEPKLKTADSVPQTFLLTP